VATVEPLSNDILKNSAGTCAIEFLSGNVGAAAGSESTQNPAPAIKRAVGIQLVDIRHPCVDSDSVTLRRNRLVTDDESISFTTVSSRRNSPRPVRPRVRWIRSRPLARSSGQAADKLGRRSKTLFASTRHIWSDLKLGTMRTAHKQSAKDFPVVCIGGSAGGLDAYTRLLRNLPADMGVAVVIVNHLRIVATQLHKILPRYTGMPVDLITERLALKPDHVFIIPAQRDLHVLDGEFRLRPISKPRGWPDVITVFLRSLTQHWNGKLIAVIVSGYDGDGAAALCGIREVGGVTIAQKPQTAKQPDMPESAIAGGCIDFVLSPEDIAQKIALLAARDRNDRT
jgi:two-component system, chemotaxis family, protein-glutamate methylesterase/glutaminase